MGGTPISFLLLLDSTNHCGTSLPPPPNSNSGPVGTSLAGSGNAHPRTPIAGPETHIKKSMNTLLHVICMPSSPRYMAGVPSGRALLGLPITAHHLHAFLM